MKKKIRVSMLLLVDMALIFTAYFLSFLLRFELKIQEGDLVNLIRYIPVILLIKIAVFAFFKLYRSLWEYASIDELINIVVAVLLGNTLVISFFALTGYSPFPRSIYIMATMKDIIFIGGFRFLYRALRRVKHKDFILRKKKETRVMIIGAGDAGAMIIKELNNHSEMNAAPVCIIDDNVYKTNYMKSIEKTKLSK